MFPPVGLEVAKQDQQSPCRSLHPGWEQWETTLFQTLRDKPLPKGLAPGLDQATYSDNPGTTRRGTKQHLGYAAGIMMALGRVNWQFWPHNWKKMQGGTPHSVVLLETDGLVP